MGNSTSSRLISGKRLAHETDERSQSIQKQRSNFFNDPKQIMLKDYSQLVEQYQTSISDKIKIIERNEGEIMAVKDENRTLSLQIIQLGEQITFLTQLVNEMYSPPLSKGYKPQTKSEQYELDSDQLRSIIFSCVFCKKTMTDDMVQLPCEHCYHAECFRSICQRQAWSRCLYPRCCEKSLKLKFEFLGEYDRMAPNDIIQMFYQNQIDYMYIQNQLSNGDKTWKRCNKPDCKFVWIKTTNENRCIQCQ